MADFTPHDWQRHPGNPVLPPSDNWFDATRCMNPFVVRQDDVYWLFYSGGDEQGHQRICLAKAPVSDVARWERLGPLFEVGQPGAFDAGWCVLPCVHRFGDKWHLYYTGHDGSTGKGLQAFWGMGLAISDDLINWQRHSEDPVMTGWGIPGREDNRAIAGGGTIIDLPQSDGRVLYRMYFTLPTGLPVDDLKGNQAKHAVVADSWDGIDWFDRRVIMSPRDEADYEDAAVIAINPWKTPRRWRGIYAGIGHRFGAYSICECVSDDGLHWERGGVDQNLSLPPSGDGWESQMTEYPHVICEGDQLRLFYCGNGYGKTGIGTATAMPLD